MKLKLSIVALLLIPTVCLAEEYPQCDSLLQHGITDITRYQSADHALAYKWHSNCNLNFESESDSRIRQASISIFGRGSGGASANSAYQRSALKKWCDQNREFAIKNANLYEEARIISDSAVQAWLQCQEIAAKGVYITVTPSGDHSDFVHFEIDSTLDANLRLFPEKVHNYSCDTYISEKGTGENGELEKANLQTQQPLIRNANIHIDCTRTKPSVADVEGFKRLIYQQGYISIQTSGPSVQFYAPEVVDNFLSTPPGAVVAFDRKECPKGWTDYKNGYGRFIRGIDKSGQNIDPEGVRQPGGVQDDSFEKHKHTRPQAVYTADKADAPAWVAHDHYYRYGHKNPPPTGESGSTETRPKNVALLLCEKL